jgi:superfamily II DNA helicase RecQ
MFGDECHQPVTDRQFRPQWAAIQCLIVDNSWQWIWLTATLPLRLQRLWQTIMGIDPLRTIFLRGPTNRLELAYNVLHVNPKERHLDSVAKHLIRMLEDDNQHPEGRRIMFVASIGECNRLSKSFGCFKHHAEMSADDRHNHLDAWKKGVVVEPDHSERQETWIIATPGLITGYDYHRVEDVIFYEMGYGLLNLVQGGGRGGRSGQRANVILLSSDTVHTCHRGMTEEEDVELLELMAEWANNVKNCRRWLISEAMDGIRVSCKDLVGGQWCDICELDSKTTWMLKRVMELGEKPKGVVMPTEDNQMLIASPRILG